VKLPKLSSRAERSGIEGSREATGFFDFVEFTLSEQSESHGLHFTPLRMTW